MKVVLATPNFHQPRGNTVTVQRIANGLENLGVKTQIVSITDDQSSPSLPEADIVHGFHAYRFFTFMQQLDQKPTDYIITMTGTDLNHNLYDEKTRKDVIACLRNANAIHVFNHEGKEMVESEIPEVKNKLYVIPQGTSEFPVMDPRFKKQENTFLFVLPAGVRKIKNIPSAIEGLSHLHKKFNHIRLWLVGPIIEEAEGTIVKQLVEENKDWVKYVGEMPHEEMGTFYEQADCILNTSFSEGQPSAILEAMGYGVPVLVSNNHGNTSIVLNRETGFIYSSQSELLDYAEQIVNNVELRKEIGQTAKKYIGEYHSSKAEAENLLTIYNSILM